MSTPWQGLLANLGIMAILLSAWAHTLDWTRLFAPAVRSVALVLAAGGAAIVLMLLPFELQPGIFFDLRAVPIALAGFLCGPLVGVAAGIIAALFRFYLGGAGAGAATIGIGVAMAVGILGHLLLRGRPPGTRALAVLAAATAAGALSSFFLLPDGLWRTTLPAVALPGASLIVIAVLMAGGVILTELRRVAATNENRI